MPRTMHTDAKKQELAHDLSLVQMPPKTAGLFDLLRKFSEIGVEYGKKVLPLCSAAAGVVEAAAIAHKLAEKMHANRS